MKYQATVELRHPKGPVIITISSDAPELASHVSNAIRKQFNQPQKGKSVDDILKSFGDIFGDRK